ncbi:MAG: hypothetical protein ACRDGA_04835 [Bacteroidota bacterium]
MKLEYNLGRRPEEEQLALDFRDGLARTMEERVELGFLPMKLPVMDDAPYRVFATMEEYRTWAESSLPRYLGYYRND